MKQLAINTKVLDRERNEYIQRRLTWDITDDQMKRLSDLLGEIRESNGNHDFPKQNLFGANGWCTFPDREWEGQYDDEPAENDEIFRNNVSLMDYIRDGKGEKYDRFFIENGLFVLDENGNHIQEFCGFSNW